MDLWVFSHSIFLKFEVLARGVRLVHVHLVLSTLYILLVSTCVTPLHGAAWNGHKEVAHLIESCADPIWLIIMKERHYI